MGLTAGPSTLDVDGDLEAAWRLAFVVVADRDTATRATTRAFADTATPAADEPPARADLLATTLRLSLNQAAQSPDVSPDSAITTAFWLLPAEQRAALWLTTVTGLEDGELGTILGLTTANAGHVAARATEWLEVALDHASGPLCQHEPKLADFLAGGLPLVEAAEIDDHLAGCPTCKARVSAYEELSDLRPALSRAVPKVPASMTIEALELQERSLPTTEFDDEAVRSGRASAVRPLAISCAGLLVIGLLGVNVVHPLKSSRDPAISTDTSTTIYSPFATSPSTTDLTGTSITTVVTTPTTTVAPTTTTTAPSAVTFPTIPGR